jgi:hypothetical protein
MIENLCKGCKRATHPAYLSRYDGYCLDCSNQGVPELHEEIERLESRLLTAEQMVVALEGLVSDTLPTTAAEMMAWSDAQKVARTAITAWQQANKGE